MLKVDLHLHTADDPIDRHFPHLGSTSSIAPSSLASTRSRSRCTKSSSPTPASAARARARHHSDPRDRAHHRGTSCPPAQFPGGRGRVGSHARRARAAQGAHRRPGDRAAPVFPRSTTACTAKLDAHPDLFDAVEWSYFWTRAINFNERAARWARAHGKPVVGNSDLHDIRQIGRTYSTIDAPRDASAICDAIRSGRVTLHTEPAPVWQLADIFARFALRPQKRPADLGASGRKPTAGWGFRLSAHAGSALRLPDAPQAAGLHAGRRPDAGARHWREHRDLQPALSDAAAAAAVPNADRLVFVWNTTPRHRTSTRPASRFPTTSIARTRRRRSRTRRSSPAATANLNEGGEARAAAARCAVTPSFFSTLRRAAVLGRGIHRRRGDAGCGPVRRSSLTASGRRTSAPTRDRRPRHPRQRRRARRRRRAAGDFELPGRDIALLLPFAFTPAQMSDNGRGNEFSQMIARLRPGATIEQLNDR